MPKSKHARILLFERKVWWAIFGDKKNPDGYEKVEDEVIYQTGGAYRQVTKDGVFFFDIPLIVGTDDTGTEVVKLYKYLQQNPDLDSYWGHLAKQGYKIMWRINVDRKPHRFEIRYSDVPDKKTKKPEGRVDLWIERINRMVEQAPIARPERIIR